MHYEHSLSVRMHGLVVTAKVQNESGAQLVKSVWPVTVHMLVVFGKLAPSNMHSELPHNKRL